MNNTLIDRYVYAVTKQLPGSMKKDIEQELRGLISDMLEERCGELEPSETDVKVVLTELGTPSELAAKYDPKGERSLISTKYYRTYIRVMPIVLAASAFGVLIGGIVGIIAGEITGTWAQLFAELLSMVYNTLLSAFAIITIIFAILDWKKVDIHSEDDLSKLPNIPTKKETISRSDCIVGIVINIILLSIFLFAPQFMGGYVGVYTSGGASTTIVPFFDAEAVKSVWWLFVISFGADIVNNIYKLIVGRWNVKTAIFNAVCNVVTVVSSAIILLGRNIFCYYISKDINSALAAAGEAPLPEQAVMMFDRLNVILFAIILFASVLSIITGFVKTFAAKREQA